MKTTPRSSAGAEIIIKFRHSPALSSLSYVQPHPLNTLGELSPFPPHFGDKTPNNRIHQLLQVPKILRNELLSQHPDLQLLGWFVGLFALQSFGCSRAEPQPCAGDSCCLCWDAEQKLAINPGPCPWEQPLCSWRRGQTSPGWLGVGSRMAESLCPLAPTPGWHFPQQVTAGEAAAFAIPNFFSFLHLFLHPAGCPSGFVHTKFKITPVSPSLFPALPHTLNLQEKKNPLPSPSLQVFHDFFLTVSQQSPLPSQS